MNQTPACQYKGLMDAGWSRAEIERLKNFRTAFARSAGYTEWTKPEAYRMTFYRRLAQKGRING